MVDHPGISSANGGVRDGMTRALIDEALEARESALTYLAGLYSAVVAEEGRQVEGRSDIAAFKLTAKACDQVGYHSDDEWGGPGRYRYVDSTSETEVDGDGHGLRYSRSGPEYCRGCYMGSVSTQRTFPNALLDGQITVSRFVSDRLALIDAKMTVDAAVAERANAARRRQRDEAERATFEKLKAKFGGSPAPQSRTPPTDKTGPGMNQDHGEKGE